MANTISQKSQDALARQFQIDLLLPSLEEAALMTPDQLKERLNSILGLLTSKQ